LIEGEQSQPLQKLHTTLSSLLLKKEIKKKKKTSQSLENDHQNLQLRAPVETHCNWERVAWGLDRAGVEVGPSLCQEEGQEHL
jgi:hypothetical protein